MVWKKICERASNAGCSIYMTVKLVFDLKRRLRTNAAMKKILRAAPRLTLLCKNM